MRRASGRIGTLLLLGGAALAVLALLLWPGGGERTARAYPGLTVGIDMNPATNTDTNGDGVYESVNLSKFERCVNLSGPGVQFYVNVFALDVVNLVAFLADVEYDGSIVKIIGAYTGTTFSNTPTMFLSAVSGSAVQNTSQNDPTPSSGVLLTADTDGRYEAQAFDESNLGHTGSGTLVRLRLETVANGVSPFNLDIDPALSRGVVLTNVAGTHLGDTVAPFDGYVDGSFFNAQSTIAVGQSGGDSDGDGIINSCDNCPNNSNPTQANTDGDPLGDACDVDDDNDQVCDPGQVSPFCTGSDNCQFIDNGPLEANIPGVGYQTDTDGDGLGNPCDLNADNDLYPKDVETYYGSKDWDASSRPEVCDGTDSDRDTLVDEGPFATPIPFPNIDGDAIPDCADSNVDTDNDGIFNPSDADMDGDGTLNANENTILADATVACQNSSGYPDWPADFTDDRVVNILDVGYVLPPTFGSTAAGGGAYTLRRDLQPDFVINILDVGLVLPPIFGRTCAP